MKYVIYGVGFRGKNLYNYIKKENIVAFIDLDKKKQGKDYCGKPIISLDKYMETYFNCFIIITPAFNNDIENILEENHIYQYSDLKNMPLEFSGYGDCKFEDCYRKVKQDYNQSCFLYGLNALSFFMYDYLSLDNIVSICPEKGCDSKKIEWVKKYYPQIRLREFDEVNKCETIFSTIGPVELQLTNKIVNLFEYPNNNKYYWNKELGKFKNLYKKKERCFIVATGPSLSVKDLYILKKNNMFCFSVNSIFRIANEWTADAYVATDLKFISDNIKSIQDYNCKYKFILNSCRNYWDKKEKDSYSIHIATSGVHGIKPVGFSEEICQKVYSGHTVTYVCLQLAVYMGFREIYLLGVDCNYIDGSKNNHFIEDKVALNGVQDIANDMKKSYEFAKSYADKHGINIYNATRGGKLEVFERIDFDLLFGQDS